MSGLDERLTTLRRAAREWAGDLRAVALELDRDPQNLARHADLPAFRYLSRVLIPAGHIPDPLTLNGYSYHGMGALERAVAAEELAWGDAGALLAAPGGSLAGAVVDVLGDEDQKAWFYGRLLAQPTWTFFALTEPGGGSDAAALTTVLTPESTLVGRKRYIGNGARAQIGVVFARTGPGALGIRAALVETAAPGFLAEPLPMIGLRAAQFAAITLDHVPARPELVLGRHLSPVRRGMWGGIQMLNRLRPVVAAMAVGVASASQDYARELGSVDENRLAPLGVRIDATRRLVHAAATAVDAGTSDCGYLASAAKAQACQLARAVTTAVIELAGPAARLEHPLLDKFARDALGLEFMEGTSDIQRLNLFHGLVTGKIGHRAA